MPKLSVIDSFTNAGRIKQQASTTRGMMVSNRASDRYQGDSLDFQRLFMVLAFTV